MERAETTTFEEKRNDKLFYSLGYDYGLGLIKTDQFHARAVVLRLAMNGKITAKQLNHYFKRR